MTPDNFSPSEFRLATHDLSGPKCYSLLLVPVCSDELFFELAQHKGELNRPRTGQISRFGVGCRPARSHCKKRSPFLLLLVIVPPSSFSPLEPVRDALGTDRSMTALQLSSLLSR